MANLSAYNSSTSIALPSIPAIDDPNVFQALIDLHNAIAALATSLGDIDTGITPSLIAVQFDLATLDNTVTTLSNNLTTAQDDITNLQNSVSSINSSITTINDTLATLVADVAAIEVVKYTQVTASSRIITAAELVPGHNIFGVNFAGAVEITIPQPIDSDKLIIIKDESGNASSNNITVRVAA